MLLAYTAVPDDDDESRTRYYTTRIGHPDVFQAQGVGEKRRGDIETWTRNKRRDLEGGAKREIGASICVDHTAVTV